MEVTTIKRVGIITTALLFVFLGIAAPVYAQQGEHEKHVKPPAQQAQQEITQTRPA
jgi:hypothetical protein